MCCSNEFGVLRLWRSFGSRSDVKLYFSSEFNVLIETTLALSF